jgi:SAM-dependent methyltransferase
MLRILDLVAGVVLVGGFLACRNTTLTPDPASSQPIGGMTREKTATPQPVSDPSADNFGGLVMDNESKQRAIWQKPDLVISQLGDLTGKTVADIGAGSGYFTFRLVPKAAYVIGIDIDHHLVAGMDSIKVRLPEAYQKRFEARLTEPDVPGLNPGEADAVIIVNTYGYLTARVEYLRKVAAGMKPGGQLLIIDFKKNALPVGPSDEFKVSVRQVEKELGDAGLKVQKIDNQSLDYQYIVLATRS